MVSSQLFASSPSGSCFSSADSNELFWTPAPCRAWRDWADSHPFDVKSPPMSVLWEEAQCEVTTVHIGVRNPVAVYLRKRRKNASDCWFWIPVYSVGRTCCNVSGYLSFRSPEVCKFCVQLCPNLKQGPKALQMSVFFFLCYEVTIAQTYNMFRKTDSRSDAVTVRQTNVK